MSKRYVVPTLFVLATGCAPTRFEQAVDYYAARNRVSDAGVHRVRGYWHLRFDALLISDLEDAATQRNTTKMRTGAERVLRAANTLGRNSAGGEIDRLPQAVRTELASRAGVDPSAEALKQQYGQRADAAIDELVAELKSLPTDALRR